MHQGLAFTAQRARRILDQRVRPAVLRPLEPLAVEAAAPIPDPIPLAAAVELRFEPFALGAPWGPPWTTTWFRLRGRVPETWAGHEVVALIDLGFHGRTDGFQAEGLVYRDGGLRHAIQPDRRTVVIEPVARGGEVVELLVEAASNPVMSDDPADLTYRPTRMGDRATAPERPLHVLRAAQLAVRDPQVGALELELHVALDLLLDLGADDPLRPRLALALDELIAALDLDDVPGTAAPARAALAPVFSVPSAPGGHRVVAVGHAHLDTAWLWPNREARRKAVRTFANAVDLLDREPDHRFAHSQAQHYAWVEQDQPALFERVRELVAAGRWEPVGGMWVEVDLNLAGGESLARQLVHGQRAFRAWFGRASQVVFLPDDFGYTPALPQLARQAGCRWFFTQKLSWNETNRFPHHTFWWVGLDGSRLFTHFSPADTYNARIMPGELRSAVRRFADHVGSSTSLLCFGHGDGGGGPTPAMVTRAHLLADVQSLPRLEIGTVEGFFAEAEAEYGPTAPAWVGELYFEKHRGTYTSQVATKQGDVRGERLLGEVELWSASVGTWPGAELDELWKALLTQQFHDVLPGSSIAWAHQDAEREHARIAQQAESLIAAALDGAVDRASSSTFTVLNPGPAALDEVVVIDAPVPLPGGDLAVQAVDGRRPVQRLADGRLAVPVRIVPFGSEVLELVAAPPDDRPAIDDAVAVGERWLDNGRLRVEWDAHGDLVSVVHAGSGREVLPPGRVAGELRLHQDQPAEYDAWDLDEPDARGAGEPMGPAESVEVVAAGPLVAALRVTRRARRSTFVQEIVLRAGAARLDLAVDVDWHEDERRLQLVVPVDVHAAEATCGVQLGHVARPRHANTSWDAARFEVVAHRYVHAGEHGFGVALLAAGPHGYDVRGDALRLTLLRSPRYPDPHADRGRRRIELALWAHGGDPFEAGIEDEAHRLARPVRVIAGACPIDPPVRVEVPGAMVSAVKRADDGSGELVVRLWECRGGRASGRIQGRDRWASAARTDLLEEGREPVPIDGDGAARVTLRPFEVATIRLRESG